MRKLILVLAVILITGGCVPIMNPQSVKQLPTVENLNFTSQPLQKQPIPKNTQSPAFTEEDVITTPLSSETIEATATRAPLPTIEKHLPTPTVQRSIEWDIEPIIEKRIEAIYRGVKIRVNLIVDDSYSQTIHGITISDQLLAEVAAKAFYGAWYIRSRGGGDINQGSYYKTRHFEQFMESWATAQESSEYTDWKKVQLLNILANDMDDGEGFSQQSFNFLPMFDGEAPKGYTGINEFTIVLVKGSDTECTLDALFITPIRRVNVISPDAGKGTNLSGNNLMVYLSLSDKIEILLEQGTVPDNTFKYRTWQNLSSIGTWLASNTGYEPIKYYYPYDEDLFSKLKVSAEMDVEICVKDCD